MHYLTHLTCQMENFGPLRHHACFRCESKNGLIKGLEYKNFKNICFSVSEKHQFWMAGSENEQVQKKSMKYIDDVSNKDKKRVVEKFHYDNLASHSYLSYCKFAKVDGFQYEPGSFLIIQLSLDFGTKPVGLIKEILESEGIYIFYVQLCSLEKYSSKLNSLQIKLELEHTYIKYKDLYFKQAQFAKYFLNLLFLQVRYFHQLIN